MRNSRIDLVAVSLLVALVGCTSTPDYPSDWPNVDWPAIARLKEGQCPRIEGRYLNTGAPGGGYFHSRQSPFRSVYHWDLDVDLSSNILSGRPDDVERGRASRWVELKQPDESTLVIELDDGRTPIIMKKGDDGFTCDRNGLTVFQSGSWLRNERHSEAEVVLGSAGLAMMGTGALETVSRSFRLLLDGSLLMKVTESSAGGFFFIPVYGSQAQYVRWSKFTTDEKDKASGH